MLGDGPEQRPTTQNIPDDVLILHVRRPRIGQRSGQCHRRREHEGRSVVAERFLIDHHPRDARIVADQMIGISTQGLGWMPQPECGEIVQRITDMRSEEHTSELQSLMRNSYDVFCLKKKKEKYTTTQNTYTTNKQENN